MSPLDAMRVWGARRAQAAADRRYQARHVRPEYAAHIAQQRLERARDAISAGCATDAERDAIAVAVGAVIAR